MSGGDVVRKTRDSLHLTLTTPLHDSFRVRQVAGMFDVPMEEKLRREITVEVPDLEHPWRIGLIVGPSGSGKTSVAAALFGENVYRNPPWPEDRAVIDVFDERPIRETTRLLTSVGFGSPPSWIKPYHVLSRGEQFRCDLARAIAEAEGTVCFDEYSSVVDRTVARFGSMALAGAIRRHDLVDRFVAVTCHDDVAKWLAPDWILDLETGRVADYRAGGARRRLRQERVRERERERVPQAEKIALEVFRCGRRAWPLFAPHHYLSGTLAPGSRCYLALWKGRPVAFCATVTLIGRKSRRRISRLVTLPDFQGVGIGTRLAEAVATLHAAEGHRVTITANHPGLLAYFHRGPSWRLVGLKKTGGRAGGPKIPTYRGSPGRAVVSWEWVGEAR